MAKDLIASVSMCDLFFKCPVTLGASYYYWLLISHAGKALNKPVLALE